MPPQKFRISGKLNSVSQIKFTTNNYSPYQTIMLEGSSSEYNYFGSLDLAGIPPGTDMNFEYEKRGKYLNVREIQGYDGLQKLDISALKEEYIKSIEGTSTPEQVREQLKDDITNGGRDSSSVNEKGKTKDYKSGTSTDMELRSRMNAGNISKSLIEFSLDSSERNEDGSVNKESFEEYHSFLLKKLMQGSEKIYRFNVGLDTADEE